MIKTTYNEYLVNSINQVLETYNDKKREQQLKNMIVEINSTHDEKKLNQIAEHLEYLINVIKQSSK
jgi:adenylyl- and sulfurtransferase ThiI